MAKQLPIVQYGRKQYFLDKRLKQIRNIEDPSDFIELSAINPEDLRVG